MIPVPLVALGLGLIVILATQGHQTVEEEGGYGRAPGVVTRPLSDEEVVLMRRIFGDTIPYADVEVRRAVLPKGFAGAVYPKNPSRVVFGPRFARGMSVMSRSSREIMERSGLDPLVVSMPYAFVLAHELMHIRQYIRDPKMFERAMEDRRRAEAAGENRFSLYDPTALLAAGVPFPEWPVETQANVASGYLHYLQKDPYGGWREYEWTVPIIEKIKSGEW